MLRTCYVHFDAVEYVLYITCRSIRSILQGAKVPRVSKMPLYLMCYSSVTHSRIERRMYHVRETFLLCSRGVSVTYLYSYGISLSRIKAFVLRTSDVSIAYEVYA